MPAEDRQASPPSRHGWRRRVRTSADVAVEVIKETGRDGVGDLAASVSYFAVFAIPAAALSLVSFLGLLDPLFGTDLSERARDAAVDFVREDIADDPDVIATVGSLFDQRGAGLFTFSLALALFSVSRAFAGLIRALDRAYDLDEHRGWLDVRLSALALSLGTVAAGSVALALIVVGPLLGAGDEIAERFGLGSQFGALWDTLRGPVALVVLVLWAAATFHIGPDHHTPWRYDLPGAVLTGLLWVVLSTGFGTYVSLTGEGNAVVGAVGSVLVAMSWLYLMAFALLIGAELNAVIAHRVGLHQPRRRRTLVTRVLDRGVARMPGQAPARLRPLLGLADDESVQASARSAEISSAQRRPE